MITINLPVCGSDNECNQAQDQRAEIISDHFDLFLYGNKVRNVEQKQNIEISWTG